MSAQYPVLYDRPINKWKVAELKEELKKRSLPVRGLKDELVRRLDEAIRNERENLGAQEEADSGELVHMKEQSGLGEGILNATENLSARDQNDLDRVEEPLGEFNLPTPPSHIEQMHAVAQEDVNGAIVSGAHIIDGSSGKDVLGPASTAEASLRSCGFQNEVVGNAVALNEETEVVPTRTTEKASDLGTECLKPLQMDPESHVTQSSSQVYEVSSNLGFQVQCESITTDNVNLTNLEKTEIKENVNTNNIQLEPEVKRQEIVQSLSHKESAGDDSFNASGDTVPNVKQGYIVEADDKCIIKSSEKTYSADNVSVLDQIMENNAPDQVADDNVLVQSAATVKSGMPVASPGNEPDSVAPVRQRELQADDPMEEDNILDKKHTDSDLNSSKESQLEIKSSEEITVNGALQAATPFNISESNVANNDAMEPSSEAREFDGNTDTVIVSQAYVSPEKMDTEASVEKREMPGDKFPGTNTSELVDAKDRDPLEKINLDQSDDSMEDDIMDMKHTDSDHNPNKGGDETMSDPPSVNGASQASIATNKLVPSEKRKIEGELDPESKEIRKRQRRWNNASVKVPEQKLGASYSKVAMARSGTDGSKSNVADLTQERVVPPSSKVPTDSLRIDNFVRPFTLKALQELLSKTGTYSAFWMDSIKTHCYVTYASVDEATATRNALYNLKWPEYGGRLLVAEFVDPEEVKSQLEAPPKPVASVQPPQHPTRQVAPANVGVQLPQYQARQVTPANFDPVQPPQNPTKQVKPVHQRVSERVPPAPATVEQEDSVKTLDDLFRKTKATPRIYYLPLSDEQVALKLGKQRN